MFAPLNLVALNNNPDVSSVSNALSSNINNLPLNGDQWDGYTTERAHLLQVLEKHHHNTGANPLFLTGDIHTEWAHTLDAPNQPADAGPLGAEIVCSYVSARYVAEILGIPTLHPISHEATQ